MIKVKNVFFVLFCCITISIQAQKMSIEVNGGLSGMNYNIKNGKSSLGFGFAVGANYHHTLNDMWSAIGGLQIGMHSSRVTLGNTQYSSNEIDGTSTAFQLQTTAVGYKEEQTLYTLNIPLLAEYSTYIKREVKLKILGGFKVFIPISQSAKSKANKLEVTGYYPNVNVTVDDLAQHGFGTNSNWEDNQTPLKLSTSIALSLQSGVDFYIANKMMYAGLYFDYGLNDISNSTKEENIVNYSSKGLDKIKAKGISNSTSTINVRAMSFGINLKIYFDNSLRH